MLVARVLVVALSRVASLCVSGRSSGSSTLREPTNPTRGQSGPLEPSHRTRNDVSIRGSIGEPLIECG